MWGKQAIHFVKLKIHFDAVTLVDERGNENGFTWQKQETINYFIFVFKVVNLTLVTVLFCV